MMNRFFYLTLLKVHYQFKGCQVYCIFTDIWKNLIFMSKNKDSDQMPKTLYTVWLRTFYGSPSIDAFKSNYNGSCLQIIIQYNYKLEEP